MWASRWTTARTSKGPFIPNENERKSDFSVILETFNVNNILRPYSHHAKMKNIEKNKRKISANKWRTSKKKFASTSTFFWVWMKFSQCRKAIAFVFAFPQCECTPTLHVPHPRTSQTKRNHHLYSSSKALWITLCEWSLTLNATHPNTNWSEPSICTVHKENQITDCSYLERYFLENKSVKP